jgi:hypothetical protein
MSIFLSFSSSLLSNCCFMFSPDVGRFLSFHFYLLTVSLKFFWPGFPYFSVLVLRCKFSHKLSKLSIFYLIIPHTYVRFHPFGLSSKLLFIWIRRIVTEYYFRRGLGLGKTCRVVQFGSKRG